MMNRLGFSDFEDEDSTFDVFKVRGRDDDSLVFSLTPFELTCFSTVNCGFKAKVEESVEIEVVIIVETVLGRATTVDEVKVDDVAATIGEMVVSVVAIRREEDVWFPESFFIPSLT